MTPYTPEEIALARGVVAAFYDSIRDPDYAGWVLNGEKDGTNDMRIALAAIRASHHLKDRPDAG